MLEIVADGSISMNLAVAHHSESKHSGLLVIIARTHAGYSNEEITVLKLNCPSHRALR